MLPFGLTWQCPHHQGGCQHRGPFSKEAAACAADKEGWELFRKVRELVKPQMKKPILREEDKATLTKWIDAEFEKDYPWLFAFLTSESWEDKSHRVTGTLLIFTQEGYLKACVNDRDLGRSAFVTAPSVTLLFDLIEDGLAEEHLDWRKKK